MLCTLDQLECLAASHRHQLNKCTVYLSPLQRTSLMEGSTWSSLHWFDELTSTESTERSLQLRANVSWKMASYQPEGWTLEEDQTETTRQRTLNSTGKKCEFHWASRQDEMYLEVRVKKKGGRTLTSHSIHWIQIRSPVEMVSFF